MLVEIKKILIGGYLDITMEAGLVYLSAGMEDWRSLFISAGLHPERQNQR
jgi:hypothetical protein